MKTIKTLSEYSPSGELLCRVSTTRGSWRLLKLALVGKGKSADRVLVRTRTKKEN